MATMQAVRPRFELEWLLDAIPDGMVIESSEGEIVAANKAAARVLGVADDAWSKGPVEALLAAPYREAYRGLRSTAAGERGPGPTRANLHLRSAGLAGRSFPLELELTRAEHAGGTLLVHTFRRM